MSSHAQPYRAMTCRSAGNNIIALPEQDEEGVASNCPRLHPADSMEVMGGRRSLLGRGAGARLAAAAVVSSPFCPAASNARLSQAWSAPWCYNVGLTRLFLRQFCFANRATLAAARSVPLDLDSLASVRTQILLDDHVGKFACRTLLVVLCRWQASKVMIHVVCGWVLLLMAAAPALQANTMDAFIERVICKVYHHATPTLDDYFSAARAHRHIPAIRTPTLFLGAADDPFLGALPLDEVADNPCTLLALTSRRAHLGCGQSRGFECHVFNLHFVRFLVVMLGAAPLVKSVWVQIPGP